MTTGSLTAIDFSPARLNDVELFAGLRSGEILVFLPATDDLTFNVGDVVFQAGDVFRSLCLLVEGSLEIDLEVPRLGERVLAKLEPRSIFGESSFFHPAPHAATVRCLTAARIMRLSRTRFDALAGNYPHLVLRVTANAAEILAARLHHTDEWIVDSLALQHDQEVREKWRNLRHSLMTSFGQPQPLPSAGTNVL